MSDSARTNRKKRIFDIIQIGSREDLPSRTFDIFIVIVILLNILTLILETFTELEGYMTLFKVVEAVTIMIFCVEYVLRIWTAEYLYPKLSKKKAVLRFLISYDGIVDLLTILPFFFLSGFAVFRLLRVVRIFHLFRINAHDDSFSVITRVLMDKKNQIFSSVFIILVLMLASSLCMYSVEQTAQPEAFENALSGLWWTVATIFTVGYGDIYPITFLGRFLAVVITFLGVGAVAIPTGIISAGFVEQYTKAQKESEREGLEGRRRSTENVIVDESSPYIGRTVREVEEEKRVSIAIILRNDILVLPEDNVKIEPGDTIVYQNNI
ncbi:MAG TPA: Ion transporter [Lachnospiraceae bacterium]|nr:Ion transporter [Lachnospiraceae bacterium]